MPVALNYRLAAPELAYGETGEAAIQLKPGVTATAEEIIEFCCGKPAGYKLPRSVDVVARIPRNASGNVLKHELREKYWAGHHGRVSRNGDLNGAADPEGGRSFAPRRRAKHENPARKLQEKVLGAGRIPLELKIASRVVPTHAKSGQHI